MYIKEVVTDNSSFQDKCESKREMLEANISCNYKNKEYVHAYIYKCDMN